MGYREVSVYEIKEVLRLWLGKPGFREISRLSSVDRKTVRRYVDAAVAAGLNPDGGTEQLTDDLIGAVVEAVRPVRPNGHGQAWDLLASHHEFLKAKVDENLKLTKVHDLFTRRARQQVPYITLYRYCTTHFDCGGAGRTVRVADCKPASELQVDFGRMGMVPDLDSGRNRLAWALIFVSVFSRHMFVFLTFRQTLEMVIGGFELAWDFFGGVFKVVIPDNLKAIVNDADPTSPRLNDAFLEYSQSRGFVVDPARVRHPKDKPRVERMVPFVRESYFKGERFVDLADAQARAEQWCLNRAGLRIHGTTQRRPLEVFESEEKALLLPAPVAVYDLPSYGEPKVHPDHHIEVERALYSVPGDLIGHRVKSRADRHLVKIYFRGQLIKTHPRQPAGGRSTDPDDLPQEKTAYAMRDLDKLLAVARSYGPDIGIFAAGLLDNPLPWTKMRQVYRLLGLVRRFGAGPVEQACRQALQFEAIDVSLLARMLERGQEAVQVALAQPHSNLVPLRFARSNDEFTVARSEGGERADD